MKTTVLTILLATTCGLTFAADQTREEKVREDMKRVKEDGFWIYNDLPKAFETAKKTGKPLLVGFRCIPCEECVKLDDNLVDTDPVIRPLLEQFVCVRVVSTNGLDLSLFQYDTDQSFAMFMLNADRTIYGRFGTRSHRTEWFGDVSLTGLAEALKGALALHKDYPANKSALAGKTGAPLEFGSPEQYPALKDRFTSKLSATGEIAKSCIHCHQIGDARRDFHRKNSGTIPEKLLYSYPHPKSIGLILDAEARALVKDVKQDSLAAKAGFQPGDQIETLAGQPLLSIADVQWVLHSADPDGTDVAAVVDRAGESVKLTLALPKGWRRNDDIAWRVSSWGLRRMVTGGMKLESLSDEERREAKIEPGSLALRASHVGQYNKHAVAKRAGVKKDDILISFNGRSDDMTPGQLLAYGVQTTKPGQKIPVTFLRGKQRIDVKLLMQE